MQGAEGVISVRARLHGRQSEFAAAVLDPERAIPHGTAGPDGKPSAKRFAIYRNNVLAGLAEALKAAFPVVCRIVGDEFFAAMARTYAALEPPHSPVMLEYGAGFPAFIRAFGPSAGLPYLCDVARLERAWVEAYHAAEAEPIDRSDFDRVDPHQAHALVLKLHPSTRVVRSEFPALTIWWMNTADGVSDVLDLVSAGENALLTRPLADVEVRRLSSGAAAFVHALGAGATVLSAAALALGEEAEFDVASALAGLIGSGAITNYEFEIEQQHQGRRGAT